MDPKSKQNELLESRSTGTLSAQIQIRIFGANPDLGFKCGSRSAWFVVFFKFFFTKMKKNTKVVLVRVCAGSASPDQC